MSDQELYEIARQHIDRRNRNLTFLIGHGVLLTAYVGLFILLTQTALASLGVAILVAWGGVFILHCVLFGMAQSREGDIEGQVAKLRKAANKYEKPKRLELTDDGEIVELEKDEQFARKN